MIRAFAALTAAGAALVALPTTAGAEARMADNDPAASAVDPADHFLATPSLFGMTVGTVLWLSVAALAIITATLVLRRSRTVGSQAASEARPEMARSDLLAGDAPGMAS